MSDKTIRKGDLVMVVRGWPCCGYRMGIGKVKKVLAIFKDDIGQCGCCGASANGGISAKMDDGICLISRLRKIDPPATGEYDGVSVRKPIKQKEPA